MSAAPLAQDPVPRHVAIVMDGNGRWAKRRFMPRFFGHEQGMETLLRVIDVFAQRGVEYLTVFAFSSENWKRPDEEVSGLMNLVLIGVSKYLRKLANEGVRIRIVGDRSGVSDKLRKAWDEAESLTARNTRINLSVAFNYGGRWDVVQACQRAMADGLDTQWKQAASHMDALARDTTARVAAMAGQLATSVDAQADQEMTTFSAETHVDNLDRFYSILRDMLLDPGWRDDDLRRLKDDSINYLQVALRGGHAAEGANVGVLATDVFYAPSASGPLFGFRCVVPR